MPDCSLADQPIVVLAIAVNTTGSAERDPILCAASGGEVAAYSAVSGKLCTTAARRHLVPEAIHTTVHTELVAPAAGQNCESHEKNLFVNLANTLGNVRTPTIVTWNGSEYDVPFLRTRTFARGIQLPGIYVDSVIDCASGDVTGGHLDLRTLLFGTGCGDISLETVIELAGGRLATENSPAATLEMRAAAAFLILARALHAGGLLSDDECVSAIHDATRLIRKESLRKPHLKSLLEGL